MVKSEQKRQQKLARKQSKDRKRQQTLIQKRQQLASLHGQMLQSAGGSIVQCGVSPSVKDGLGYVGLSRRSIGGQVACFILLVDTFCLGVKNVAARLGLPGDVEESFKQANLQAVAPEIARGLVETAIEFAALGGLKPHPDYQKVAALWGDIERGSIDGLYAMGSEGRHLYINGPFEDVARQNQILSTLAATLGGQNFRFTIGRSADGFGQEGGAFGEDFEFNEEDDDGLTVDSTEYRRIDQGETQA